MKIDDLVRSCFDSKLYEDCFFKSKFFIVGNDSKTVVIEIKNNIDKINLSKLSDEELSEVFNFSKKEVINYIIIPLPIEMFRNLSSSVLEKLWTNNSWHNLLKLNILI